MESISVTPYINRGKRFSSKSFMRPPKNDWFSTRHAHAPFIFVDVLDDPVPLSHVLGVLPSQLAALGHRGRYEEESCGGPGSTGLGSYHQRRYLVGPSQAKLCRVGLLAFWRCYFGGDPGMETKIFPLKSQREVEPTD